MEDYIVSFVAMAISTITECLLPFIEAGPCLSKTPFHSIAQKVQTVFMQ